MRLSVEVGLRVSRKKIIVPPSIDVLEQRGRKIGSRGGLVTIVPCCIETACHLKVWANESLIKSPAIFGCWSYELHDFRCDREFLGVTVYLKSLADVVHFRLAVSTEHTKSEDDFLKEATVILG